MSESLCTVKKSELYELECRAKNATMYKQQVAFLTEERDRYREALEKVLKDAGKFTASYEIARDTLEGK